jgi:hypothetical protein
MAAGVVTRAEWRWVAGWSAALLLLTGLPYAVGVLSQTPDLVFSGFFTAVEDGNTYLAAMHQGAAGRWAFHIPFTPEPHDPGYVFGLYLLLGRLSAWSGLAPALVLHLAKLVTTPLLLAGVYRFAAQFTGSRLVRRVGFILVAAGGGFGWLWVATGQPIALGAMPTDLWVTDASAWLTLLTFPHLALAQALILWVAVNGLQLLCKPSWPRALVTGLLGLALGLVHPYSLPLVLGLLALTWLVGSLKQRHADWRRLLQLALAGLIGLPYLVYSLVLFTTNPVFNSWQAQNTMRSPDVASYLLGFGLLCPLALIGLLRARPLRRWNNWRLLMLWVVLVPLGLYIPSNLQRRWLDGYQAPLTLMALAGLLALLHFLPRAWRRRALGTVVALSLLTSMVLLAGFTALVAARPPLVFIPQPVETAMAWLDEQAAPDSVVLAAYDTGNRLPARALVRSFVGHGPQSVDAAAKREQVQAFFGAGMSDADRLALLEAYDIAYVFYGPTERALGDLDPARLPGLQCVYSAGGVDIYRVVHPAP